MEGIALVLSLLARTALADPVETASVAPSRVETASVTASHPALRDSATEPTADSARPPWPWNAMHRVLADGRDRWTLLDRHLVNRQLFSQLKDPMQATRLNLKYEDLLVAAVDASVGTQQTFTAEPPTRFHGLFILDAFAALRPLNGLDINLNLLMFNPSASDGYRVSADVNAGVAMHLYLDLFEINDKPVHMDVLASDLGLVTLGRGLLIEQLPLEGIIASIEYDGWYIRHVFGGQIYWSDDLLSFSLGTNDGLFEISFIQWLLDTQFGLRSDSASFGQIALEIPVHESFRVGIEAGIRLDGGFETGALLRADYLGQPITDLRLHLGYQFRWYGQGYTPNSQPVLPTTNFNTPIREDAYVTNPFEYLWLSPNFDQWSHTGILETSYALTEKFRVFLEIEAFFHFASSDDTTGRVVFRSGERFPGSVLNVFYRAGISYRVWLDLPHRFNIFVTNKQVRSVFRPVDPIFDRFPDGRFFVLEGEAFF